MATGWGRGTWGSDYFGATSVEVSLTGVAATASVGALTTICEANVVPTGQAATASLGTPVIQADCNVSLTGVAATASVGAVTSICEANTTL